MYYFFGSFRFCFDVNIVLLLVQPSAMNPCLLTHSFEISCHVFTRFRFSFHSSEKIPNNIKAQVESRLLDTIDFVLCLDTIGQGDELFLHISRPPKTAPVERLYKVL